MFCSEIKKSLSQIICMWEDPTVKANKTFVIVSIFLLCNFFSIIYFGDLLKVIIVLHSILCMNAI